MSIELTKVDYSNSQQADELLTLLNVYATDAMGGAKELTAYTKENLARALQEVPNAFSIICYVDGQPAGLANCFQGFSTFKCKPLVNIHDLAVAPEFRGKGLSSKLLAKVEEIAVERGCCKVTLEVLSGNKIAINSYVKAGFEGYELDPAAGQAMFWEKVL